MSIFVLLLSLYGTAASSRLTVQFPYTDRIVFTAFGDWGTGDAEQALIANQVINI